MIESVVSSLSLADLVEVNCIHDCLQFGKIHAVHNTRFASPLAGSVLTHAEDVVHVVLNGIDPDFENTAEFLQINGKSARVSKADIWVFTEKNAGNRFLSR